MMSARFFVAALLLAAGLVVSAPFIGQVRNEIRARFPGQFVLIVGSIIAVSVGAALLLALVRIRNRRVFRYSAIAAALALAVVYAVSTARADPQVNAVERFHFVEYGLITLLFYKAWRPLGDGGALLLPILAALTVAMIEEWFQWFIPGRVGALEDVLLNWAAILSGLLFSIGFDPPPVLSLAVCDRTRRHLGIVAAIAVLVFGGFFDSVHLGYEITDPRAGVFVSIYRGPELLAHAQDRAQRWRSEPPVDRTRLAREDQYRTEGIQHVRRRNEAWVAADIDAAWRENVILETYYAPVLDGGHRWPAEQRTDAQQRWQQSGVRDAGAGRRFVSGASPYPIYTWPRWLFWLTVGAAAMVALITGHARQQ
jgi:VanZ family protein